MLIHLCRKRQMECTKSVNTCVEPLPDRQNQVHRAQKFFDNSHRSSIASPSSILVQSLKISPCQRTMWYFHRMIVVVTLWIMCCCSSEAFASRSNNSFFGRKLSTASFFRGGSSSTSSASSTSTTTPTKKSASDSSSTSTLTCVMQAPPRITSTINGGFNNDDNRYNDKKRKNGVEQPSSVKPNGVSFYRSAVSNQNELRNPNISVQDVITAAVHVAETKLPTEIGQFQLRAYRIQDSNGNNNPDQPMAQQEPCVIYSRDKPPFGNSTHLAQHVPVRIHDQCLTSEVFGSQRYVNMSVPYVLCYNIDSSFIHWSTQLTISIFVLLVVIVRSSCIWRYNI